MYTWRYSRDEHIYTVGLVDNTSDGYSNWEALFDCNSKLEAMELISFLNGGNKPSWLDHR